MQGPAFFSTDSEPSTRLRAIPWDVRGIKNGLVYEKVRGDDLLIYYAIDLDRSRVYHVMESGGLPDDEDQLTGK